MSTLDELRRHHAETLAAGQVHITVTASSLVDDDALIVATLVDGPELGAFVLVVDEHDFRRLASHDIVDGREFLTAAFQLHADGASRWAPYLVPRDGLAARFGVEVFGAAAPLPAVDRATEGFLGEAEVIRRLAEAEELALFRPFPDLETVEILARHMSSRRFLGLQVKTSGWEDPDGEQRVYVRKSSFRPSPSTSICVLGWNRSTRDFAEDCLLIPSTDIEHLARMEAEWLVLEIEPGARSHRRLDRYRVELHGIGTLAASMLA
jgi:hypothetical protein